MKKVLLVQPSFPIPLKSKNHKDFLPIGLLKLGAWHKKKGNYVKLVYGNILDVGFEPDIVLITSLFTYWSEYVVSSAHYYRAQFPDSKIIIGGIYASLMPDDCKQRTGADEVHIGIHLAAEMVKADYSLLGEKLDYQILHTSRGCFRRCSFCYVWKIEPEFNAVKSIQSKIHKNKVVFYDNNLLYNPEIKQLLKELADVRVNNRVVHYESQSGFDGRILMKNPDIGSLLKKARFKNPRIAWDHGLSDTRKIERQIDILVKAGYNHKEISVFMLYNWEIPSSKMEEKRRRCWNWKIQIADCRFRPYTQLYDYFDIRKIQTSKEYYIHPKWTDDEIKLFRRRIRRQNICVRMGFPFYHKSFESKQHKDRSTAFEMLGKPRVDVESVLDDVWFPED